MTVYGVDISSYQGGFAPSKSKVPLGFAILKASEGDFRDTRFNQFVQSSAGQVPYLGAYHYFRSGVPLSQQLQVYRAATAGKPIAFNAVDYEATGNVINAQSAQGALQLVNALRQSTGKPTYLYTNQSLYETYFKGSGVPLWLSAPSGQYIQANPTFVQTSFNAPAAQLGVSDSIGTDFDVFKGSLADLGRELGAQGGSAGPIASPPPAAGAGNIQNAWARSHGFSTTPPEVALPNLQMPNLQVNLLPKNVTDFISGPALGQTMAYIGIGVLLFIAGLLLLVYGGK